MTNDSIGVFNRDMNTEAAARTPAIAAIWEKRPERVVTISTGIVHVAINGHAACGTRQAARVAQSGLTPTCRKCGAVSGA